MSQNTAYARAGVDIEAGHKATNLMKTAVKATYGPEVLAGLGAFGGLFDVGHFKTMAAPVLVASTDGVGTKTKVAAKLGRWDTIGQDLVNHCVNDILVQGAKPLFFLDYVASSELKPVEIATIVQGVTSACQSVGCALLGGETAEMPGVYEMGEIDLVGTIVGVVEREAIFDGSTIQTGDIILGLASTGLHTNGYTLARHTLNHLDWFTPRAELGTSIGEALLAIHRVYLQPIQQLQAAGVTLRGLAHITGGGVIDNLPRILPDGLGAVIQRGSWPEPTIFSLIQREGAIAQTDMFHAFNMGLGMLVIVPAEQVELAQSSLTEAIYMVGEVCNQYTGVKIVEN